VIVVGGLNELLVLCFAGIKFVRVQEPYMVVNFVIKIIVDVRVIWHSSTPLVLVFLVLP